LIVPGWAKTVAVVLVLVFVFAAFVSIANPGGVFDGWDTTGKKGEGRGYTWEITTSKTDYIGSWMPDMSSESFAVQGKYQLTHYSLAEIKSYRYALYVSGSDEVVKRWPTDGSYIPISWATPIGTWFNGVMWSDSIKTDGTVRLKFTMDVVINDYFTDHYYDGKAWDGARLNSGYGDIFIPANQPQGPFEEGEKATVYVHTGYSGTAGWMVYLAPPADRTDIDQTPQLIKNLGNDLSTQVDITIPIGAFKAGSSNKWEAQLCNQFFFPYKFTYALTIDQHEWQPIITSISTVNNGNSYRFTVITNRTYQEITSRTDTESWIDMDRPYPVSNNVATFTVTPKNMDGTIVVWVIAYDSDMRPSAPKYITFVVEEGRTDDIDNDPLTQPWVWTDMAIITVIVIVLIVAAIWAFGLYGQVKWYILMALSAIVGILGALVIFTQWAGWL
jgi:hypothetical protein